jgi:hypothetical protein
MTQSIRWLSDGHQFVPPTHFEASWAPVDELDRLSLLDLCYRGVDVLRDDVSSVQEANRHILAVAWVALYLKSSMMNPDEVTAGSLSQGYYYLRSSGARRTI